MSRRLLALFALVLVPLAASCGDPTVYLPPPIEVAYMPLDGAVEVAVDVELAVYFSGEVDEASITADSVFVSEAAFDGTDCASAWTELDWSSVVDGDQPEKVVIATGQTLQPATCYRITCTTAVKGVELGPLMDLGIPERPGIGAEAVFRTAQ